MIATTAIRYELTARSSTNPYIALRISWSPTVLPPPLRLQNLLDATTHAIASQSQPSQDSEISSSIASTTNAKLSHHVRHRFTETTAVEDNCKRRSRHRFMIATTAIRLSLLHEAEHTTSTSEQKKLQKYPSPPSNHFQGLNRRA